MDYKRLIKALVLILIIVGIGVGGYFIWKWVSSSGGIGAILTGEKTPTTEVINTTGEGEGEITTTESETTTQPSQTVTQKLSILINSPVFEYWINSKEKSLYFANLNGQIIRINSDSTRQMMSSQILNGLNEIIPSNDGSFAVAEFNYPQLTTFSLFSASSTSWQPFATNTISTTFSPDSQKIAYLDNTSLKIMDLVTAKISETQKMSQVGLNLNWTRESELILSEKASAETITPIYNFNLNQKKFGNISENEYGVVINWSKTDNLGIKLSSSLRKPVLTLVDELGSAVANLTFITIPEKCLIESQKIYCGVPKNIRTGMILPDDYYKKKDYFIDDIFEMDLPTGKVSKIFDGKDVSIDAHDLKLKDGNLLFINRYDSKLYSLKLD